MNQQRREHDEYVSGMRAESTGTRGLTGDFTDGHLLDECPWCRELAKSEAANSRRRKAKKRKRTE
ncbi:hypothetical protein [Streptomyces sp. NPDC006551]|uniref:hypothetical protein n=1 Tax=Streptomyces sp. NPDC006551 TaxID=3157178 RepID=UPI00339EACD3